MRKTISWLSLLGIITLSCNVLSPKISETPETQAPNAVNTEAEYQDGVPVQEFSLDAVDSIPAEDILLDVMHFDEGGPGDNSYCKDENDIPYKYVEPTLYEPEDVEFMFATFIKICGWVPNQTINVKIINPNGMSIFEEYKTNDIGALGFSFAPDWGDPIGVYSFEISNENNTFFTNVLFYESNLPRIYYINEEQLLLKNFSVGETISLYVFKQEQDVWGEYDPVEGWKLNIDKPGEKIINIPAFHDYIFIAMDSLGIVYDIINLNGYSVLESNDIGYADWKVEKGEGFEQKRAEYETIKNSRLECSANTKTVINDEELKFYKTNANGVEIYFKPRLSAKTQLLEKDQPIRISNIYYCYDNLVWRLVELPNFSGYILEKDFKPEILQEQNCGDLPTRLSWNKFARVSFSNGNNKNIRKEPGFTEDVITQIAEGTYVTVWNDWCVDNTHWWHVRTYEENFEGWMTESQNGNYFLEPTE